MLAQDIQDIKQYFNYQTDSWRLKATFTYDKLNLELEDLVEWIVYAK